MRFVRGSVAVRACGRGDVGGVGVGVFVCGCLFLKILNVFMCNYFVY